MLCELLNAVYGWLKGWIGVDVEAVQVFSMDIHAEVPVKDSIYIDHWNYHENKHFPKHMGSQIFFT